MKPTRVRWRRHSGTRRCVRRGLRRGFVLGCGQAHLRAGHVVCVGVYGNLVLYSSW